jgi:PAS domain S-box-containing protein
MTDPARSRLKVTPALLPAATAALAIGIFVADRLTPVGVAISGLYVVVVLLAPRFLRRRGVMLVAAGCVLLTLGNLIGRPSDTLAEGFINALSSIGAIWVTAFLALQGQAAEVRLRDQASLLDLTHDTIFVRGMDDVITYWNRGASELYGWSSREAVGKVSHQLTQTAFPAPLEEINAQLLRAGRWEGELIHTKRDATRVTVASRWSLQRDAEGRPATIMETNNDITGQKQAEHLAEHVFDSSPDGMCIIGTDYRFQRVNPVYARLRGAPADEIVGKHVAEVIGVERFEQASKVSLDQCFAGEEFSVSGWISLPLGRTYLSVSYAPLRPHSEQVEAALAITRDITDLVLASERLRAAQADLAHVNRVATMGQLTASIAHEVNQPIAAAVINAQTALRWLEGDPPDLAEAGQALCRVIDNGGRAADVIARIRAVVSKAPPRMTRFDLNEAVGDVIALTRSEALKQGVSVQSRLATDLPSVEGDRVQVQQVILNLIMNAIEAMSGVDDGARELRLSTEADAVGGGVLVAVRDSGPGLDPMSEARLFDAFYTTKPEGMGMGLAICRSIAEAHGGRLWASANEPRGAVFQLMLPAEGAEAASAESAG